MVGCGRWLEVVLVVVGEVVARGVAGETLAGFGTWWDTQDPLAQKLKELFSFWILFI